jgi:hypothetical protein
MFGAMLIGALLALVTAVPLAWKWLGVRRVGIAVSLCGAIPVALVAVLGDAVHLDAIVQAGALWHLTLVLGLSGFAYSFRADAADRLVESAPARHRPRWLKRANVTSGYARASRVTNCAIVQRAFPTRKKDGKCLFVPPSQSAGSAGGRGRPASRPPARRARPAMRGDHALNVPRGADSARESFREHLAAARIQEGGRRHVRGSQRGAAITALGRADAAKSPQILSEP